MKKEDIFNGVSDIRDDLIEKAGRSGAGKKRLWRGTVAALLAVCVAGGSFAAWRYLRPDTDMSGDNSGNSAPDTFGDPAQGGGNEGGDTSPADGGAEGQWSYDVTDPRILALAEYPERERYPETDGWEYDTEQYAAWREEQQRKELTEEELESLNGYMMAVAPKLLEVSQGENAVCSPINVYMALGMLSEVTDGQSREQILKLLGCETVEEARERASRVWNALYNDDGNTRTLLANSLWLDQDISYVPETVNTLAADHYASVFQGEMGSDSYNGLLHDWLNGQTAGLMQDQVEDVNFMPHTTLGIASTVYFSDRWDGVFDENATDTRIFHAPDGDVEREFMNKSEFEGWYYWSDNFAGTTLRFETSGEMRVLLPDEGVSLRELLTGPEAMEFLTNPDAEDTDVSGREVLMSLSLPKFDVAEQSELSGTLKELGVTDIFDPETANLAPIFGDSAEPNAVDKILHGARVKVDEEGCEAAAYTLITMYGNGAPPDDRAELIVDRPFLFSVVVEGVPMFLGAVNVP